ncbi:hypothetical protein BHYA_0001g00160 [Botrytis hyacinthi]|uniref:Uncharacterized protein n=1 Tax=Botrytis hyacinthi TaxID=278943 RepID=A0A4Z1HEB8_9HELO|nr:hypothetical protein BHYA_0001g00160 [Botrytis hyacinthi]
MERLVLKPLEGVYSKRHRQDPKLKRENSDGKLLAQSPIVCLESNSPQIICILVLYPEVLTYLLRFNAGNIHIQPKPGRTRVKIHDRIQEVKSYNL